MRIRTCKLLLVVSLVSVAPVVAAQQGMSAEQMQQALARAQGLLRQVAQQKAALETEVAGLRVNQAGLEKKLRVTEIRLEERDGDLAASQREAQRTGARLERSEARLEKIRGQLEEVVTKYRELAALQRQTQAERERLDAELGATRRDLADAQARNRALYETGRELLGLYDGKSAWDSLLQHESVTGLKKVEIQNRVQEIEYRLYDELTDANVSALSGRTAGGETSTQPAAPQ